MSSILCFDRGPVHGTGLHSDLSGLGHEVRTATTLDEARRVLGEAAIDLVIARAGSDQLTGLLTGRPPIPVLLVGDAASAAGVLPEGCGVVETSSDPGALRDAVERALRTCGIEPDAVPGAGTPVVGRSPEMRRVVDTLRVVAGTRATVLIEGESGTGKELLVRALHGMSPRARGPFVAVNCAALPEGLVESSLFGHERGAFTGAAGRYVGAFERAHRGTLLLDEISELRLDLQAKLLRAIQEREFERVGGSRPVRVDVRVVATTNRSLREAVAAGRFREDLYYRLRVVPVVVPPLRERPGDVSLLVDHFVERTAGDLGLAPPPVPEETLAWLETLRWPGNVRQLEHAVERAVILNAQGPLLPGDFLLEDEPGSDDAGGDPDWRDTVNLKMLERRAIERALEMTGGHRARAAGLLGISERTLRNKLSSREVAGASETASDILSPRPEILPFVPKSRAA